jgi:hypothetical protein
LTCTVEDAVKEEPVTVTLSAAPPAIALAGARLDRTGAGLATTKFTALDVPPPGAGFATVTLAEPGAARSAAVICAVRLVGLT